MSLGYTGLETVDGVTYETLVDRFEWRIPERYSIAEAALDPANDERTALVHTDDDGAVHRFTYHELRRAAAAFQAHLAERGVGRGDRIALCGPQSPELLVAHLGVYRLGAVAVPVSVITGTDAFAHSLDHADTTGAVVERAAAARFADVLDRSALDFVLPFELSTTYDGPQRALGGLSVPVDPSASMDAVDLTPDDPALVVYTSGTSGSPKGVVQNHQYLIGTLPGYQLWFEVFGERHRERVWTPAEWAWAGALFDVVFPTLAMGGTVCSRVRRRGFDAETALEHIAARRISRLFVPATALRRVRDETDPSAHDLTSLAVVMAGGEKLPGSLLAWSREALGATVNECYGQTEANALIGSSSAVFETKPDSMGRPYPGHECRIVDEDGEELPIGETGEIVLDLPDPVVFDRYWKDPDATAAAFTEDGRYRTGDLALRDEEGYVRFRGRADDLIISSGYRISPTEVEVALSRSRFVSDVAVGGVPDSERGQRVTAFVVLNDGVDERPERVRDELTTLVSDELGAYKTPREIVFLDDPPETRTGKLDRSALFGR
ncbi:acyl-CoA synthetase [Halococcus sp. IIIV-5B]|uniref:acyl-CoA synthetase n=1 Tax=Halococcus sp. IIIV-5B TaxID=2321230 RepID=UPI0011C3C54E|nr:AMP-binding protein [Halococcus sp. IIIV-5B]